MPFQMRDERLPIARKQPSLLNFALVTKLQQWMTYFTQECCRSCKPLEIERYRLPTGCIV
jgi:hypothetical protein